ncbi:MAG: DUF5916 domain-containing protein, partial [Acidobacteriota bacterium]
GPGRTSRARTGERGQSTHGPVPSLQAVRVQVPPTIDGRLDEETWRLAPPAMEFTQRDPDEGQPATERTELRILFDDTALYVGVRLFDSDPSRIVSRLSRRDSEADADRFTIYLDPRHDHLTGAMFQVSAAGALRDGIVFNDTSTDESWDGVWDGAATITDEGWSAEMRIPLSQLRFTSSSADVWGVNAVRYIQRKNESSWLALVPKAENGLAARMAHLSGLSNLSSSGRLEVLPYTVTRAEFVRPEQGDPFNDGARALAGVGVDIKRGVTSNLTLDATINPDFGQVEVDPAVVNLTGFETFFEERRPFFIEGAQIFTNFGRGGSNSSWGFNSADPLIFYSRRIGRSPQGSATGAFVDAPTATTILGAAKLSGKTSNGWSLGVLNAVTGREAARVADGDRRSRQDVEPLTNYFVGRAQYETRRIGAGILATGVERSGRDLALTARVPRRAYVVGGDAYAFLDAKRDWVVHGMMVGSTVRGSRAAIADTQRASQRYLQRPDTPRARFDPNATSLSGWTGRVNLNRNSGLWQVNAALWGVSPGFESGDLGFTFRAGVAGAHSVFLIRKPTPDRFTRERVFWAAKWWTWDYDRRLQGDGWNAVAFLQFLNYWRLGSHVSMSRSTRDNFLTRGGPAAGAPGGRFAGLFGGTDGRKAISLDGEQFFSSDAAGAWGTFTRVSVSVKPAASVSVSVGPEVHRSRTIAQYVRGVEDETAVETFGGRYVFANLRQTQISMVTRLNWLLSPRMSVQVYAQPLLATGDYSRFKEFARPGAFEFREYGADIGTLDYDPGARRYAVDPDRLGPARPFQFADPDFNFKSMRVNAVFRWEWRLGSTLYVVWTERREDFQRPGVFSIGRDTRALFAAPADDVVLVKFAYWIGR